MFDDSAAFSKVQVEIYFSNSKVPLRCALLQKVSNGTHYIRDQNLD